MTGKSALSVACGEQTYAQAACVARSSAWRDDGRFERINHALVMADRERVGRDASPSAAIIDSQSVKTTEAGSTQTRANCSTG